MLLTLDLPLQKISLQIPEEKRERERERKRKKKEEGGEKRRRRRRRKKRRREKEEEEDDDANGQEDGEGWGGGYVPPSPSRIRSRVRGGRPLHVHAQEMGGLPQPTYVHLGGHERRKVGEVGARAPEPRPRHEDSSQSAASHGVDLYPP